MSFTHKAGSDSGVDYATVAVFLLWLVMTIGLVVFLVVTSSAAEFPSMECASASAPSLESSGERMGTRGWAFAGR
jgi:hypothetical protein